MSNKLNFLDFISSLEDKTIHIIYSYRTCGIATRQWYDQWQTSVISYFGESVELLGAQARFLDIETFIRLCSEFPESMRNEFIINLNAGFENIDHWCLVPAIAGWYGAIIAPCSGSAVSIGERKDVANALAYLSGFKVPEVYTPEQLSDLPAEERVIVKPRDFGGSRGVVSTNANLAHKMITSDSSSFAQKFIEGYDLTVSVIADPCTHQLEVIDTLICKPEDENKSFIQTEKEKDRLLSGKSKIVREAAKISNDFLNRVRVLVARCGHGAVARVDFRIENYDSRRKIEVSDVSFLEINIMPTISKFSSYGMSLTNIFNLKSIQESIFLLKKKFPCEDSLPQAYLVSSMLYWAYIHAK
ncbi:ATP-grasp domain-containing protein [Teredinibacter turnerae]|uniref:ATP-grasp domain-containing protein n=1 Tax=Teredinibacter turnerae TaxID=2426 RepID=UPI0030D11D70